MEQTIDIDYLHLKILTYRAHLIYIMEIAKFKARKWNKIKNGGRIRKN